MRRIRFIAQKEFYHILRDPRSLAIVFAIPILMTFIYGYAINLDIENIVIAIVDYDRTFESRELTGRFYNSTYFSRPKTVLDTHDPQSILRSSQSTAILTVRPGFAEALEKGEPFHLGMTIDGSDPIVAATVQAYSNLVLRQYYRQRIPEGTKPPGIALSHQVLYNPDLRSSHFFVPGLVAIILLAISALLTSVTIAREKETGTLEQLLSTPVRTEQILIGKLLPYVVIALADGILVLVFAKYLFGVPFVGSQLLLLGYGLVYVTAALSIGILISSIVSTQQVAMMTAAITTMLPSVMLSGFIFPIKNMPLALQAISYLIPARYFLTIVRGIMLKGAGVQILAYHGLSLLVLMLLLFLIAVQRFKARTL